MEIIEKNINDLIPYEFNNKIHDVTQIDRIANSIKEFGFLQPVVIDKNNIIIVGHGRVEGAKKLGLEKVPCVQVENLTEAQIKKYRILDNKLNESERDVDNLKIELEELGDLQFGDMEINFDEFDIDQETSNNEIGVFEKGNFQNKEIGIDDLGEFEHKCPKCGFEFNSSDED